MRLRLDLAGRKMALGSLAGLGGATLLAAAALQMNALWLSSPSVAQVDLEPAVKKPGKPPKQASAAPPTINPSQPPPAGVAAPAAAQVSDFQLAQQLQTAGIRTCLQLAEGMGRFQMAGVTEYASSSTWSRTEPDRRLFSAIIGQRFAQSAVAPLGLSGVISSPGADGKCDAVGIQVLPTASACSAVQKLVLAKGELLGNLAGVPFLRNTENLRIMLLPTAGNGCVIVGLNNYYSQ